MNYPRLPIIVTPRARDRLLRQRDWYNVQLDGLGDQFYEEILVALEFLEDNYHVPPSDKSSRGVKRFINQGRFPWLIYYKIMSDHLVVASFSHPKQRPRRRRD